MTFLALWMQKISSGFRIQVKMRLAAQAARTPYFVPENIKADILFRNMKKVVIILLLFWMSMAAWMVIPCWDLIEQLVGDLVEEDDEDKPEEIVQISDNTWRIQGCTLLDDVEEALDIVPDRRV